MKNVSVYSLIFLLFTAVIPAFLGASEASQGDSKSAAAIETVVTSAEGIYLTPVEFGFAQLHAVPETLESELDEIFDNEIVGTIFAKLDVQLQEKNSFANRREAVRDFDDFLRSSGFRCYRKGNSRSVYYHENFPNYVFKIGLNIFGGRANFGRLTRRQCIMADLAQNPTLAKLKIPTKQSYIIPTQCENILFEQCILVVHKEDLLKNLVKVPYPEDMKELLDKYAVTDVQPDHCRNLVGKSDGSFILFDLGADSRLYIPKTEYDAIQADLDLAQQKLSIQNNMGSVLS